MNLAAIIEYELLRHSPLTVPELARKMQVADHSVRDVLRLDERFVAVRLPGRSEKAIGWMLKARTPQPVDEWGSLPERPVAA